MIEAHLNLHLRFTQEEILKWPPEEIADFWENVKIIYLVLASAKRKKSFLPARCFVEVTVA